MSDKSQEWYYINRILSYNKTFNFILSERGIGKTYGTTLETFKICLRDMKKPGDKCRAIIWVRRNVIELDPITGAFSSDMVEHFPDYEFKDKGLKTYVRLRLDDDATDEEKEANQWCLLVYIMAVKWFKNAKGNKINKFVKFIVFDEFLSEDNRYYKGYEEPGYFMNICTSFIRNKTDCRVILLANAIQLSNPYFETLNLTPNLFKEFTTMRSRSGVIQICPVGKYGIRDESGSMSTVTSFLSGTIYENDNNTVDFKDNTNTLIDKRSNNAVMICALKIEGRNVSVWYDYQYEKLWYSSAEPYKTIPKYSFDGIDEEFASAKNIRLSKAFDLIIKARENNNFRFESIALRELITRRLKGSVFI